MFHDKVNMAVFVSLSQEHYFHTICHITVTDYILNITSQEHYFHTIYYITVTDYKLNITFVQSQTIHNSFRFHIEHVFQFQTRNNG